MLTLFKLDHKTRIFRKVIKETYQFLKSKKKSLSFTVERTFAFAFFAYLEGSLENL